MNHPSGKLVIAVLLAGSLLACNENPVEVRAAPPVEVQASVQGSPGDRQAIQQIVAALDANWGVNAAAYAAVYGDADFVSPTGLVLSSQAQIQQLYTNLFPLFAATTRSSQIRSLTFLTGTLAVLDIDTRVTGTLPGFVVPWQPNTVRALEKNILIKRGGTWRILQHQQVTVAPGVP